MAEADRDHALSVRHTETKSLGCQCFFLSGLCQIESSPYVCLNLPLVWAEMGAVPMVTNDLWQFTKILLTGEKMSSMGFELITQIYDICETHCHLGPLNVKGGVFTC